MMYDIHEIFYSIKGEGQYTGVPMTFIRLSGCNLNCAYCDTDYTQTKRLSAEEIIAKVSKYPAERVVITGGEPTLQALGPLTLGLHKKDYQIHLETNGTIFPDGIFNWIAVSPKVRINKLDTDCLNVADEVKFICGIPNWREIIDEVEPHIEGALKLIMPLAHNVDKEGSRDARGIIQTTTLDAINYVKEHPEFRLCIQAHKYLNIP